MKKVILYEIILLHIDSGVIIQIYSLVIAFGVDKTKLRSFMVLKITETSINEFGRFEELKSTVNKGTAKIYFENIEKMSMQIFKVNIKIDKLLREFILSEGFEI